MELSELNPHIRYVKRHIILNNRKEKSINYDCRIYCVTNGEGYLFINSEKIPLKQNTVLFFPYQMKYMFHSDSQCELLVFNFDLTSEFSHITSSVGTATESTFDSQKVIRCKLFAPFKNIIIQENFIAGCDLILKAEKEYMEQNENCYAMVSAYVKLCLLEMLRENMYADTNLELVNSVCSLIKQNFSANITNRKIAEKFHYHPHHLSKIMKKATGKTLRQYLINYRITVAKRLLSMTDYSIDEIAWKSGFSSTSYFIKIFRQICGKTPKKYRRELYELHF